MKVRRTEPVNLQMLKHELRTPLNHLVGYSKMLQEMADEFCHESTALCATRIYARAQALHFQVEQLFLDSSRQQEDTSVLADIELLSSQILDDVEIAIDSYNKVYSTELERIRTATTRLLQKVRDYRESSLN